MRVGVSRGHEGMRAHASRVRMANALASKRLEPNDRRRVAKTAREHLVLGGRRRSRRQDRRPHREPPYLRVLIPGHGQQRFLADAPRRSERL